MRKQQGGFTLIEIAIVLVIIGLLLGGVLKGQELITAARVRNLISTQDGVKAAYFGFLDRYRALPGDYSEANAKANIPGCSGCFGGDANGQIQNLAESIHVWEHLSKAGFITGSYVSGAAAPAAATSANTPSNPYGSLVQLIFDATFYEGAAAAPAGSARHNLKTGNNVPSDIMAEVDRKVDDGLAGGGQLRFSDFTAAGTAGTFAQCTGTGGVWLSTTQFANCGAALLF
jgi:prepilin-type N-terminal cleavage/methylation domain-containing protein